MDYNKDVSVILEELLKLEEVVGEEIITIEELKAIDKMWASEGDLYRRTLVETYYKIKGKRLPWDQYRTPLFSEDAMRIIDETCEEYGMERELINKLVVAVEENKHFSKGNKVEKAFERVINEGWLHHSNIKAAKEEMQNENK